MREKALAILQRFAEIDEQMAALSAGDPAVLTELGKERKRLEPAVEAARAWLGLADELNSLEEILAGNDAAMRELAGEEKKGVALRLPEAEKRLSRLLNPPDPRADKNTIIEIRPGAGGDEAGLFVGDLFRMYTRFAQNKGLAVEIFSSSPQGVGGYKEATFGVRGHNAFGWFRFEQGVHRVQRVPETEAQGRIHTSTATVAVLTEASEVEIKVDPKDLRIDTYRSSGAGGQHVNKTDSAIRITHIPSGIVVACQEERSQGQNRLRAMALLRARLQEAAEEQQNKERRDLRKKQIGTGDRSEKIRTYNFPQDRITDHRINVSVFNIQKVLSGELDELINALVLREEELREAEGNS